MVEANLKIFKDLTWFMQMVTTDPNWRAFFTQDEADFSRNRDLPMPTVIMMILDFFKRSLGIEIQEYFHFMEQKQGPSISAFCQQRQKLNPVFFQFWNQLLEELFYHYYGNKAKRWHGFLVIAGDGSTTCLPAWQALIDHFGTHKNQHKQTPMAQIVQLYDVLNNITIWGGIYPAATSEASILCSHLQQLPQDSLLLLDRGFPSFALMYLLLAQPSTVHFVIRCKLDFNNEVKAFIRCKKNSKIVKLRITKVAKTFLEEMGYSISGKEVVKVRMVKFKLSSGQTEVLLTNLYDGELYRVQDFKALYALRWGIETCYDKEKNKMQLEQYSGYSVTTIEQDYYACVFVLNVQSLIEKQCSEYLEKISAHRKYTYKINTNLSLGAMKHYIVRLFILEQLPSTLQYLQQEFERNVIPIRPGRHFKHKRKPKRLTGKYQTLTNYKRAI